LKEIQGVNIPTYSVTSGDCETSPTIVPEAGADKRCWWTCGGCTRSTDITTCNKKGHWGLTFDDGPTESTPKLLTYLNSKNLKATFYMVGSRVISHPEMAQYQHLSGHELSVHTWSHASLTMLTNEQIVAELGWTRKAIKDVTGVTPLSMRPPRGDIDDRVRAISLAMGMTPILWTGIDPNAFDTNDWRVSAGQMTAQESAGNFSRVLDTANTLNTGFIVLEHDNHAQPVNLAIGTTIPLGQSKGFTLEPVHQCLERPLSDSYAETVKNPAIATPRNGTPTNAGVGSSPKPTGAATGLDAPMFAGVFAAIAAMLF
jgi:peptidoglycan/xylan/chitin deacetylase (PgdA/CDA1 family)